MNLPIPTPAADAVGPLTIAALIRVAEAAEIVLNETCGDVEGGTLRVDIDALDRLRAALATIPALGG